VNVSEEELADVLMRAIQEIETRLSVLNGGE